MAGSSTRTPMDDAEFASHVSGTRRYTDPTGAPAGRMDLLTAVMHEMGHALGLEDSYHEHDRDALMYGFLTMGERRLPTQRDAVAARAPGVSGARARPLALPLLAAHHRHAASRQERDGKIPGDDHEPHRHPDHQPGHGLRRQFRLSVLTDDPNGRRRGQRDRHARRRSAGGRHRPTDQMTDVGLSNATFTAAATSNPAATVQWFVQTNGAGAFNPVPVATSNTLTITSATLAQNGNVYHAVYTNTFTDPDQHGDHHRRDADRQSGADHRPDDAGGRHRRDGRPTRPSPCRTAPRPTRP